MSELFNHDDDSTPNATYSAHSSYWYGNTFTPTSPYNLDYVVIKGSGYGDFYNVYLDIYLADEEHKPTGNSLATVQIPQVEIPTEYHSEITFVLDEPLPLSAGQEYAYVITSEGTDVLETFLYSYVRFEAQDDYLLFSSDSGSSWTAYQGHSSWFQMWGTGPSKATNPSPSNGAVNQKTNGVELSWTDDNPGDSYDIYFGPTGNMVLVESEYSETSYTYSGTLAYGQEYQWRIDINIGEETVVGDIWTFTVENFSPPSSDFPSNKRLIAVSNNQVWYEDI